MDRKELNDLALSKIDSCKALILNLPTGSGKTKIAIDLINHICDKVYEYDEEETDVLIVVPQKVLIENWKEELKKWHVNTDHIEFICYNSLSKKEGFYYDIIVLDEDHHLTESRQQSLKKIHVFHNIIGLSATIPKDIIQFFEINYETEVIKATLNDMVDSNILPAPVVYKIPLKFDPVSDQSFYLNPKAKGLIEISYSQRFKYINDKKHKIKVNCNKSQYYSHISSMIEWYKRKYLGSHNEGIKFRWLKACNDRLKWLAKIKLPFIQELLIYLNNQRTITFCASIEDSNKLCKYSIDSKAADPKGTLTKFNEKRIKHITAVSMLDEGLNLKDCAIGIMAGITSSEIKQIQRIGRSLRAEKPVIILPYWEGTREEEIVISMLDKIPGKVYTINNIGGLKQIKS